MREDVRTLIGVYASAFALDGPSPKGALWPNAVDLGRRFDALLSGLDLSRYSDQRRVRVLDVGCGAGLLLDFLAETGLLSRVDYLGVDVFEETLASARARWPNHRFELCDVRERPFAANAFDWAVVCGVFTGRFSLTPSQMEAMAQETLCAIWRSVQQGVAFNTMSTHVDWQRDDLFHWPLDAIMSFCKAELSRHVSFRLNYGLWEVAAHVRKAPLVRATGIPDGWVQAKSGHEL